MSQPCHLANAPLQTGEVCAINGGVAGVVKQPHNAQEPILTSPSRILLHGLLLAVRQSSLPLVARYIVSVRIIPPQDARQILLSVSDRYDFVCP